MPLTTKSFRSKSRRSQSSSSSSSSSGSNSISAIRGTIIPIATGGDEIRLTTTITGTPENVGMVAFGEADDDATFGLTIDI